MSVRSLIFFGNPILRKKAKPVQKIDGNIKRIIDDLIVTLKSYSNGVGLAANQIGELYRVVVIRELIEEDEKVSLAEPEVFINPELSEPSVEKETMSEGCLSIPGIYEDVSRPVSITVTALDVNGNQFTKKLQGYTAREIMHEKDHLDGVLFVDRISSDDKKRIKPFLHKIKKKYNPSK